MKLEFRLLVIDDEPNSIDEALGILSDHLTAKGFTLKSSKPTDLSPASLKQLARKEGRDFDLVIIDYNLGKIDATGADAAAGMRQGLPYTDIIFYSSNTSLDLLQELAKKDVAGVFVAHRPTIGDTLIGIADTIIGKAVDLNHMRGIAMAEVADLDVIMGECLEAVFSSNHAGFKEAAVETLVDLKDRSRKAAEEMAPLCDVGDILTIISDSRLFSSAHKFWAIRRAVRQLSEQPKEALVVLSSYTSDVIGNRNTLAHAKEDEAEDGRLTLRSPRKGADPITIDDAWMADFRTKLRAHREALTTVCTTLLSAASAP